MRNWISIISFSIIVFIPGYLYAQDNEFEFIPKVAWTRCGDQACMTFEETKKLARMRAQYTVLFEVVPTLRAQSAAWEAAYKAEKGAAVFSKESYDRLFTEYTELESDFEKAVRAKNKAEAFSVFRGALPWVVAGLAVSFAGGMWVGAKF